jgi:hypothetical protein
MRAYTKILDVSTDVLQEFSRLFLTIMFAVLSGVVSGYHKVKDKYLEYKYTTNDVCPTSQYYLTSEGRSDYAGESCVPPEHVYIEEWFDTKGHKKMVPLYEGDVIPHHWDESPFDKPPAKCPWVWVGDRETEIDLTRTFDKFLVSGNRITVGLVSKLIKITDHTNLIYIETKTFNHVKFPGDGITIDADTDETL